TLPPSSQTQMVCFTPSSSALARAAASIGSASSRVIRKTWCTGYSSSGQRPASTATGLLGTEPGRLPPSGLDGSSDNGDTAVTNPPAVVHCDPGSDMPHAYS